VPANPADRAHARTDLWAIGGVALALRLALIATTRGDPLFDVPMLDAEYAVEWARKIRAGDLFGSLEGTAYFRPPLYAWFLAAVALLPGDDLLGARVGQAVLGAATAVLLAAIAGRFGRIGRLATGALAATAWPLLHYGRELLPAALTLFWGALLLFVQDRAGVRSGRARWLAIGAIVGLGAATRPDFLVLAPAALVLAFVRAGRPARVRAALLVGAGILACIAPITVRNRIVSGEWVLVCYQGGLNLWIGNNPDADGMTARLPGFTSWRNEDVDALLAREKGRVVGPGEQDAHFQALALAFFRDEPARALALLAKKAYLLVQGYEIRNDRDLYALRELDPILGFPGPDFGWIGPLALAGFVATWSRRRELAHLWAYALATGAGVVLFFVCARYRMTVWPPLLVYAGAAVAAILGRSAPARTRLALAALLLAAVALARADFLGIRDPDRSQVHYQYGNVYARVERNADAEREFREALRIEPGFAEARHHFGALLLRQGRVREALPELRRAVAELPLSIRARRSLAEACSAAGAFADAVTVRREAAALSANDPRDVLALADALGMAGRRAEAWDLYVRLWADGVRDPYLALNGGQTALALGRVEEGREWLERAMEDPETRALAHVQLGRFLVSQGRADEALRVADRGIAAVPGEPDLHRIRAFARDALADTAGVIADLEAVLALDPDDATAREWLAALRVAVGE
jgi:tetratricopeptide (TPR) repeat protein